MDLATFLEGALKAVFVVAVWINVVPMLVWGERKVSAWIQERTGPNRVGPWGLIQPVADVIKFFFKEDVVPAGAHRALFFLAPCLEVFTALIATATIPFGDRMLIAGRDVKMVVADLDVGVLWIFAIGSLSVYGILLAGWSSNNHFSFMGGLRSSAQIISYELGMTLSVVGVLLFTGSLRLREVVEAQGNWQWNIWLQPVGFVIFLVAIFAETNRNPFDLAEAESELIAGYHTEYSAMRFAMFFMAEYLAMITMSALLVTLFLGGWKLPFVELFPPTLGSPWLFFGQGWIYGLLSMAVFFFKVGLVLFLFLWTRWTLPRFRYDQLMALGWKGILPLAMLQLVAAGVKEVFGWGAYAAVMAAILAGVVWFLRAPRQVKNVEQTGAVGGSVIAFGILAVIAVVSALLVVGTRNPVVSALWLALTFVAIAGLFVVLGAEFLAAVQIIVYAGAILVFFLFVIMLLNLGKLPPAEEGQTQRWLGLWLACAIGIVAAFAIRASELGDGPPGTAPVGDPARIGNTAALATVLYRDYIYPFEIASILLTAAVVGAVVLARKKA